MSYSKLLEKIITDSKISIKDIATKCKDYGITITPSYISQLKSGKANPPSDEISSAIAHVCGASSDELILEAYLDRAPDEVINYIVNTKKISLEPMFGYIKGFMSETEYQQLKSEFENLSLSAFILQLNHISDSVNTDELNNFIETLNLESLPTTENQKSNDNKNVKTGFYNNIESKIKELTKINLDYGIFIESDAMEPLIPQGSYLKLVPYSQNEEPNNADIIVFHKNNRFKKLTRRYYNVDNKILLVPMNSKYETIQLTSLNEYTIEGKVVSYKVDI